MALCPGRQDACAVDLTTTIVAAKTEGNAKEAKAPMLKHEYAEVNGQRFHNVTAGKGKLIMIVHGFPEFWYEWFIHE